MRNNTYKPFGCSISGVCIECQVQDWRRRRREEVLIASITGSVLLICPDQVTD